MPESLPDNLKGLISGVIGSKSRARRISALPEGLRNKIVDKLAVKVEEFEKSMFGRRLIEDRGAIPREIVSQLQALAQVEARCPRCQGPKEPRESRAAGAVVFGCEDCTAAAVGQ